MGLFYLLTLYCFIRGTESVGSRFWLLGSLMACLLGMASKEVMVIVSFNGVAVDRRFVSGKFCESMETASLAMVHRFGLHVDPPGIFAGGH